MKFWEPLKLYSWKSACKLLSKNSYVRLSRKKSNNFLVYFKSKEYLALLEKVKLYSSTTAKYSSVIGVCAWSLWLFYQLENTLQRIDRIVPKDALDLDIKTSEYIYLDDTHIKEKLGIQIIDLNGNIQPSESHAIVVQLWEKYRQSKPWRWLSLARSDSWAARQRAVKELATLHCLEDSKYQQLSQAIDAKTAVALARTPNVNERLFLIPSSSPSRQNQLNENLKHLLETLNRHAPHSCVDYFLSKAFADYSDEKGTDLYAYWLETMQIPYHMKWILPNNIVELSLRALVHHCSMENFKDLPLEFVKENGLSVLMDVYQNFNSNEEVVVLICELLFLCSLDPQHLEHIFSQGWIGVLAKLLKRSDIRIRSWAAKVLNNLDTDAMPPKCESPRFHNVLFLLHPTHRCLSQHDADVILVHGLLGNIFVTWRQRDETANSPLGIFAVQPQGHYEKFHKPFSRPVLPRLMDDLSNEFLDYIEEIRSGKWTNIGHDFEFVFSDCPINSKIDSLGAFSCPTSNSYIQNIMWNCEDGGYTQCWPLDWLTSDIKRLRMLGVNYETSLSHWLPYCPQSDPTKRKLEYRSEQILEQLLLSGVGEKPIIFITHSMGGLLVKNMLCKAWQRRGEKKYENFVNQTKSIMFFSTPHKGATMATLNEAYKLLLLPSVEVNEMRLNSPTLIKLHEEFLHIVKSTGIRIVSFAETEAIVLSSLKINIQLVPSRLADPSVGELYEIPLDHMNICKPDSKQSFIYQKVLECVQDTLNNKNT